MLQNLKKAGWIFCMAAGIQTASAFSLDGPKDVYHIPELGYIGDFSFAPQNLNEEFRWNMPVLYYAYDDYFYTYFGSNGVFAVDEAVAMINALTNVSLYSPDLSEFPLDSMQINYTAQAYHLFDLKSAALEMLVERLGLTDPEEFTWTLRVAALPPGAQCPNYVYEVIKRNFDPVTLAPSSYVNGNLFTYHIFQTCQPVIGDAAEILVDPLGIYRSAVASSKISVADVFYYGYFHTTLTRDDLGGLRYLYRTNNMNTELAGDTVATFITNTVPELLYTSNLAVFASQALTNDAAALTALYPDLVVAGTTPIFTNVVTTNVVGFFTTFPWSPADAPPTLVFATNYITNATVRFNHSFANLITNSFFTNGAISLLETNSSAVLGITNVTLRTFNTGMIMGDYYIIPTNLCGYTILSNQLTTVTTSTNLDFVATNAVGITNDLGYSRSTISYFTNHVFVVLPVACPTNALALRPGIEKVTLVKREYDSLLGRFFYPITNSYRAVIVTNNMPVVRTFERIVEQPDIVFNAEDIVTGPTTWPIVIPSVGRETPNWVTNTVSPGHVGPGTIQPSPSSLPELTFNAVGPIFENVNPLFIDETNAVLNFIWATFDASTNLPIVYPTNTSIYALEEQVLIQIEPRYLPEGYVTTNQWVSSTFYTAELAATSYTPAFTPPYTWSMADGSPGLPPGLVLTTEDGAGVIFGTPTADGFFDFVIRVTDSQARTVDRSYSIKINP